jgi:UDP-N-acetylmuramyl pentapeptide phosphotransferase/UDP-N-acetylglucosamine-1-phosphate transferase
MSFDFLNDSVLLLIASALFSMLAVMITIPVVVRVAHEKELLEVPNGRSSHLRKTPRLGGIAIFSAIAIIFLLASPITTIEEGNIHLIVPSIVILFLIGLKDDILVIDPYKKLLAQLLAAGLVTVYTGIKLDNLYGLFGMYELSFAPAFVLSLFVFVVIINAYNLIDGIDGLAAGLGIVSFLAFGTYFFLVDVIWASVLCAVMIGALAGFIRFNFSRRNKTFMGDSGSLVVGFVLALMAVKFLQFNGTENALPIANAPTIAILILAVPLFDTLRVFTHRIVSGSGPFKADRNHIHHLILDKGFTHLQVTVLLSASNAAILLFGFSFFAQAAVSYSFAALIVSFLFYSRLVRRKRPGARVALSRKIVEARRSKTAS